MIVAKICRLVQSMVCVDIIREQIILEDLDFDVQQFVSEIGVNRTLLYKKIKTITGCSVNEFIKIQRPKKAATMLLKKQLTVREIAYSVGFSEHTNFTRSFRNFFGQTPTEYQKSNN